MLQSLHKFQNPKSINKGAIFYHENYRIYKMRRLLYSRSEATETGSVGNRQIRENEDEISQGTQPVSVEQPHSQRHSESPFKRGKRPSREQTGDTHRTDESSVRNNGAVESIRPDEMGRADEQHQSIGRGNSFQ